MEGPYRDLGNGFARLLGAEGARRSPGRIHYVEDALHELLRNSRDAGARNIYVASSLRARRYRALVVVDDGQGFPESHRHLIFEPGVTTRHLDPVPPGSEGDLPHGAGLSLYHVKNAALSSEVLSTSSPTAIKIIFDTHTLPEKSLQAGSRTSKTNLLATTTKFSANLSVPQSRIFHASPANILARLLKDHIILMSINDTNRVNKSGLQDVKIKNSKHVIKKGSQAHSIRDAASALGVEVSLRTVQRVIAGEVPAAREISSRSPGGAGGGRLMGSREARSEGSGGTILSISNDELAEIRGILRRAAASSYLELAGLEFEARPGEVILRGRVYEPEEEYE